MQFGLIGSLSCLHKTYVQFASLSCLQDGRLPTQYVDNMQFGFARFSKLSQLQLLLLFRNQTRSDKLQVPSNQWPSTTAQMLGSRFSFC